MMMGKILEKRKGGPEKGQERHEGCKRKQCKLQMLLREKDRTEGILRATDKEEKPGPNFDDILLEYGYRMEDERRLCRVKGLIKRIQEQGNCEGISIEGTVTIFVKEEFDNPKPFPKPKEEATRAVA
jgi:hypothetical protein